MVETSFCDLRAKSVINVLDGKNLGRICDIVLEICTGQILGFVVPGSKNLINIFKGGEDIFIPYRNVCKIGQDVILVELNFTEFRNFKTTTFSETINEKKGRPKPPPMQNVSNYAVTPNAYKTANLEPPTKPKLQEN